MNKITALTGAAALGLSAWTASADELRMVSAFPEGFVFTEEIVKPFMTLVEEETGDAVSFSLTGPDAVPPLEQLEPVQAGVFDAIFTHPAYHAGTTPVGLAIDAIGADPVKRREAGIIN